MKILSKRYVKASHIFDTTKVLSSLVVRSKERIPFVTGKFWRIFPLKRQLIKIFKFFFKINYEAK